MCFHLIIIELSNPQRLFCAPIDEVRYPSNGPRSVQSFAEIPLRDSVRMNRNPALLVVFFRKTMLPDS